MIVEISTPTLISEGTQVQGTLTFYSGTQVFGLIEGTVSHLSLEPLQIGKSGWINGHIQATGPVIVEGRVDGDITSETRIKVLPTAVVRGALRAPSIDIRAGAAFDGEIAMEGAQSAQKTLREAA